MKNENAKKRELVILSLKKDHAEAIKLILGEHLADTREETPIINKVYCRICKALDNIDARELGYPRGVKQMKEEGALNRINNKDFVVQPLNKKEQEQLEKNVEAMAEAAQEVADAEEHMAEQTRMVAEAAAQ
jgi:hypothetical protein